MAFEPRDYFLPEGSLTSHGFVGRMGGVLVLAIIGWFLGRPMGVPWAMTVLFSWPWACVIAQRCRGTRLTPWLALTVLWSPAALLLSVLLSVRRP